MSQNSSYLVGVTGGLGSGKSTVCRFLSETGCRLFEADQVARELQMNDPEVIEGIKRLFGAGVYSLDAAGHLCLDRKRIAEAVFSSSEKLQALNQLIHPKVFRAFENVVLDAAAKGDKLLVKEAAILFESGGARGLDAIVVVTAELPQRIERAVKKGMGTPEEIMQRIARQWSEEKLVEHADYVIENKGSLEELKNKCDALYKKLLRAASLSGNHF